MADSGGDEATAQASEWFFLSEWQLVARRLRLKSVGELQRVLAGSFFVMAGLALVLAAVARADCLVIKITAILNLEEGLLPLESQASHVFGYLGELNHGLFYLGIAPAFIWIALEFCKQVGNSCHEMIHSGLVEETSDRSFQGFIAQINRYSSWILLACFAVVMTFNTIKELGSLIRLGGSNTVSDPWDAVGYVQAPYLKNWVEAFNAEERKEVGRAALLKQKFFAEKLSGDLASKIMFQSKFGNLQTASLVRRGVVVGEGQTDPVISGVDLERAANSGMLTLKASAARGAGIYSCVAWFWHGAFLLAALGMEILFQAFCGWACYKVVLYVVLMFNLLPHRGTTDFVIKPWLRDTEKRFGMDPVFRVYNLIALTISIGGSFLFLQGYNSTDARSQMPLFHQMAPMQVLGVVVVLVALFFLLAGPAILFRSQLLALQIGELRELEDQLRRVNEEDHAKRKDLMETLRLIQAQTTWPKTDATFLSAIGFSVACLLFPFPSLFGLAPEQAHEWGTMAGKITGFVHETLLALYQITI
jgi:hypothetical protein